MKLRENNKKRTKKKLRSKRGKIKNSLTLKGKKVYSQVSKA